MEKAIKSLISTVNKKMKVTYKGGGWIDARRTPTSGQNMVNSLEEFIDAVFNQECYDIPELREVEELLGGRLFSCTLEGEDEARRRYKQATMTMVSPEDIENPSEELIELLETARKFFGGTKINFNSVPTKIRYSVEW